ncbi:MAG: hypothetical protein EHM41_05890 [Chloroflexi bacterium]|nr:MAG: hypothetical protein EHM41_05890 [Chloroflexota bacterium]
MELFYTPVMLGRIEIGGKDRIDFLQRQTTNDLHGLNPSEILPNVLTSPTARILDFFYMYPTEETEKINLISLSGKGSESTGYLQKKIFFMDKVTITDESRTTWYCSLWGVDADRAGEIFGFNQSLRAGEIISTGDGHVKFCLMRQPDGMGLGILLEAPIEQAEKIEATLTAGGAQRRSEQELKTARIEAGLPGKFEYTEEYTPFEVGLQAAVSSQKGCYTGQEVLARQVTYDKVTRILAGLKMDRPVVEGAKVVSEGSPAGKITSATVSSRFGPIALAVLRQQFVEDGKRVVVRMEDGETGALVKNLPFE